MHHVTHPVVLHHIQLDQVDQDSLTVVTNHLEVNIIKQNQISTDGRQGTPLEEVASLNMGRGVEDETKLIINAK